MGLRVPWPLGTCTTSWNRLGSLLLLPTSINSGPWKFPRPELKEMASGCRWEQELAVEPLRRPGPPHSPGPSFSGPGNSRQGT